VWLVYYKKHTGKPTVPYNDAVEEAICFGWIDGQIRRLDDERYMQRYSPRNPKSLWSESNIQRAKRMIREGRMTPSGLKVFREAMAEGQVVPTVNDMTVPSDFEDAMAENPGARENFSALAPSSQLVYVYWITSAKRTETRLTRIRKAMELLAQNKKLGDM